MIARLPARRSKSNAVLFGSRTEAQCGSGNVQAQAVYAGLDPATGVATYAVRIANNSEQTLQTHVRFGTRAAASAHVVAPFSIVETMVARPLAARPDDRAIVEVRGSGLALAIDAPASLPARAGNRHTSAALAAACVAAGSLALAGGLFAASQTSHAPLMPRAQTHASPPVAAAPHRAPHAAPKAEPLLDPLDVTPASVVAGTPILVRYGAHAQSGDVWLLDERGRVFAKAAMGVAGASSLMVPAEAAGRELRVVATAHRGSERAQRSALVSVAPDPSNVAQVEPSAPPSSVTVSPERVPSGGSIHIRLAPHHGEALIAVTDQGGSIVEEVDVQPDRSTATLRAPEVGGPTTYDVVVTITKGNSQDQTVHPIAVIP